MSAYKKLWQPDWRKAQLVVGAEVEACTCARRAEHMNLHVFFSTLSAETKPEFGQNYPLMGHFCAPVWIN